MKKQRRGLNRYNVLRDRWRSLVCQTTQLYGHKAVQCDGCEMWIHNKCSLITDSESYSVENTKCTLICPKRDFFNFSESLFADQLKFPPVTAPGEGLSIWRFTSKLFRFRFRFSWKSEAKYIISWAPVDQATDERAPVPTN